MLDISVVIGTRFPNDVDTAPSERVVRETNLDAASVTTWPSERVVVMNPKAPEEFVEADALVEAEVIVEEPDTEEEVEDTPVAEAEDPVKDESVPLMLVAVTIKELDREPESAATLTDTESDIVLLEIPVAEADKDGAEVMVEDADDAVGVKPMMPSGDPELDNDAVADPMLTDKTC